MARSEARLPFLALIVLLASPGRAQDWPCWRGADGDGVAESTEWSPQGAKLWSRNVGVGFSSASIVGERLFTLGFDVRTNVDTVFCLSAETGAELWTTSYRARRRGVGTHDGGTLTTPTVTGERVLVASREGWLRSLDAATGEVCWLRNLAGDAGTVPEEFGFSVSPLVFEESVIAGVDRVVAVDEDTGAIRWQSDVLGAHHSTPTLFELGGEPRLAVFGQTGLYVLDPRTGRNLCWYPWEGGHRGRNVATPVTVGERIFISSLANQGCALLEFGDDRAQAVWISPAMQNRMAGCVLVNGHLYGFDESLLKCLDLGGREVWRLRGLGDGAVSAAGERLVLLSSRGELIVADASPEGYRERARTELFEDGSFWSPPVFAGGRIYTRSSLGEVACTDHRRKPAGAGTLPHEKAPSPALPDARSLFARHLERVGGAERVRRPRSIRWKGSFEMRAMGVLSTTVEIQQLVPDLRREEIQFPRGDPRKVIRVFDGEIAWELNRIQGDRILDGDAQREARQASDLYAAASWESTYSSLQTAGIVEFADRPAYLVDALLAGGPARRVYFDVATGFLLGHEGENEALVIHDDWRAFDGLHLPMFEKRFLPHTGIVEVLRIQTVEFDTVAAAAFARPPEIQALLEKR